MALHDVAQASGAGFGERLVEPALEHAVRERRPWPDQIEIDPPGARADLQVEVAGAGRLVDRARQLRDQQAQPIAVAVQPEPGPDHGQRDRRAGAGEAAIGPAGEIGAVEVGGRPGAGGERLGGARQGLELPAQNRALLDQDARERGALGRRQHARLGQHLGRGAQRGDRRPLRLDQLPDPAADLIRLGEVPGGVGEIQHEPARRPVRRDDQGHPATQLAPAVGGRAQELGPIPAGVAGGPGGVAVAQLLEGVGDRLARQQAVERPVETELGAAVEGLQRRLVEQQDAPVRGAHQQAVREAPQHRLEPALLLVGAGRARRPAPLPARPGSCASARPARRSPAPARRGHGRAGRPAAGRSWRGAGAGSRARAPRPAAARRARAAARSAPGKRAAAKPPAPRAAAPAGACGRRARRRRRAARTSRAPGRGTGATAGRGRRAAIAGVRTSWDAGACRLSRSPASA